MKKFIKEYCVYIVIIWIIIIAINSLAKGCNKQYTEPETNWYNENN